MTFFFNLFLLLGHLKLNVVSCLFETWNLNYIQNTIRFLSLSPCSLPDYDWVSSRGGMLHVRQREATVYGRKEKKVV